MDSQSFEKIVSNQKYLNLLINDHKYGVMCNIKKTPDMNSEFIDWISPRYYTAFIAIYNNHFEKNKGIVFHVLQASFLANKQTHQKLADFFSSHIDHVIEDMNTFYLIIEKKRHDASTAFIKLKQPFDLLTKSIFNTINTPELKEKKEQYCDTLLACADIMYHFSPSRDKIEFAIYKKMIDHIKVLNGKGNKNPDLKEHDRHIKTKTNWYIIMFIILVLIIAYKIIRYIY